MRLKPEWDVGMLILSVLSEDKLLISVRVNENHIFFNVVLFLALWQQSKNSIHAHSGFVRLMLLLDKIRYVCFISLRIRGFVIVFVGAIGT